MLLLTDLLKFYAYSGNNIIVFPYRLFVIGVILLTVIFFRDKKYSIVWSFAATTYVSLLFCVLFFPVVIDPGDNYNFTKDIRNMITFYNPYYRLLYQTEYSVCHLIMYTFRISHQIWNRINKKYLYIPSYSFWNRKPANIYKLFLWICSIHLLHRRHIVSFNQRYDRDLYKPITFIRTRIKNTIEKEDIHYL